MRARRETRAAVAISGVYEQLSDGRTMRRSAAAKPAHVTYVTYRPSHFWYRFLVGTDLVA